MSSPDAERSEATMLSAKGFVVLAKLRERTERRRTGKYAEHRTRPKRRQNGETLALPQVVDGFSDMVVVDVNGGS